MHLFAGIGGGLLADLILGHTPIVAVEWEPYACQVLRERAADGWFPDLRVWEGDVRLFDPSEYAGKVDCIHAGFPCQPFSVAGLRKGSQDERGELFAEVIRCIEAIRPKYVFLENVPGLTTSKSPSCVCGWPYRRGGLHSHSKAIKQANLHRNSSTCDDGQSPCDSGSTDGDIWWEFLRDGLQERKMGEAVAMAYQWGKGLRLIESNPSVPYIEKAASNPGVEFERDEENAGMDGQDAEDCRGNEAADAHSESEGAGCPECGSGLVADESRHIWYMESIFGTLAAMGYDSRWLCIRASDVGAPHHRDRWFAMAHSKGELSNGINDNAGISMEHGSVPESGNDGRKDDVADTECIGQQGQGEHEQSFSSTSDRDWEADWTINGSEGNVGWWDAESLMGRVANGIPNRVHRLKGLGNAQVPLQAAVAWKLLGGE